MNPVLFFVLATETQAERRKKICRRMNYIRLHTHVCDVYGSERILAEVRISIYLTISLTEVLNEQFI